MKLERARVAQERWLDRKAWATSVAIHLWLLALLLWLFLASPPDKPPSVPLELTTIDLGGPPGDRAQGSDRPAPKPLERARPIYRPKNETEPRPRERARVAHARPAAQPRTETRPELDPAALAAEERRQKSVDQQLAAAAGDTGSPQDAAAETGSTDRRPAGGTVSVGRGASGDLSGRTIESLVRADFPTSAAGRHAVGWRGTVAAALRVAPDGTIADVRILRSSGDPDIDAAAMAAFRRWRFSPLPAGRPAEIQAGKVRMRFELR